MRPGASISQPVGEGKRKIGAAIPLTWWGYQRDMLTMIALGEQAGQRPVSAAPPGHPAPRVPRVTTALSDPRHPQSRRWHETCIASGCRPRRRKPHPSPVVARRCAMRGAAPTPRTRVTALAGCVAAVSTPWTFCMFAVRARVQQALATQKHRQEASPHAGAALPPRPIVMLVESDVIVNK